MVTRIKALPILPTNYGIRLIFVFSLILLVMIRTGLDKLDEILGGGLKSGTITDIFGASGTGKTQLALQVMIQSLSENNKILYQDTTGGFRPERLIEMCAHKQMDSDFLDKISVARVINVTEQQNSLDQITKSDFSLIVIDNVTDLFSFEYPKEEQILQKTAQFSKYMKKLSQIALETKIPILLTNMVRKIDDTEQENMDSIISLYTHVKIKLTKTQSQYMGQVLINPSKKNQFPYTITKQGLTELT
ncbi:MAG: ATPase domain-containing protein [Candidatus Nitrosotenuis sp.]